MSELSVGEGREALDEASDQELVALVRDGNAEAYATLWRRHSGPAYGVARSFVTLDADDLVSEAFAKVLGAIRSGGGPARAFRPYITMTVRNIGRSLHVREAVLIDADFEWRSSDLANGEVLAVADFERCVALQAFDSLPVRWQEVLWYSEVDGLKVRTISTYLGIPANAVSALLVRAKRGLRDAWVSAHLASAKTPECVTTIRDLGAYTRRRLSLRAAAAVSRHLGFCEDCRAAHAEAKHASSLLLSLLPLIAGTAGAVGYAAQASAPSVSHALAALLARPDAVASGLSVSVTGAPGPVAAALTTGAPVAASAAVGIGAPLTMTAGTAVLSVMTAAIIAVSPAVTPVQAGSEYLAAATAPVSTSSTELPAEPSELPSPVAEAPVAPAPVSPAPAPEPVPAPVPVPSVTSPAEPSREQPLIFRMPFGSGSSLTTRTVPYPLGVPTDGDASFVWFTDDGTGEGFDEFSALGAGDDTSLFHFASVPPSDGATALSATLSQPDPRYFPQISGDGAWPGATIVLTDGRDVVVGSSTVESDGSWRAKIDDGLASGTVHAIQVTIDRVSAPSAEMAFQTVSPPEVRQIGGEAAGLSLAYTGAGGATLQREIVGVTPLETVTISSDGEWQETVAVPPGTHTVRVRYADPTSGDAGPFAEMTFEAR